jgi:hypothetical protein
MICQVSLPYAVLDFKAHNTLKYKVLGAIENIAPNSIAATDHQIYKTDWNIPDDIPRKYVEILRPELSTELSKIFITLGFDQYTVHNIWFQQYIKHDSHSWHNHKACHYTCIYYLELPTDAPKTQFLDPIDQKTIFEIDIKEGDILIIPSMIKHRSPIITNNVRKTIISFNASVICDNKE